eukprot:scaffold9875_cov67-Phaeocystis_antarctica.AAC.3
MRLRRRARTAYWAASGDERDVLDHVARALQRLSLLHHPPAGGGPAVVAVSAGDGRARARLLGDVAPIPSRVGVAVRAAGLRGRGGGARRVRPGGRASARRAGGAAHAVGRVARKYVAPG